MCQLSVISINGASQELLSRLIKQGHAPVLEKLIAGASNGILKSALPALDTTSFASFHTGLIPAQHRIFGFSEMGHNGLPNGKTVSSRSLTSKTLFEILSDNNKKIVSVYIPLTSPPKLINGCIIGDTIFQNTDRFIYPDELARELFLHFGDLTVPLPQQFFPAGGFKDYADIKNFIERQTQVIAGTEELASYLIEKSHPDAAFIQFYASDTLQHALWHYIDSAHPGFIKDEKIEQAIYGFFSALDNSIGKLLNRIKPQHVLIFSDHGFRPCIKILNLKRALRDFDVLNYSVFAKLFGRIRASADFKTIYTNNKITNNIYRENLIHRLESLKDAQADRNVMSHVLRVDSTLILDLAQEYASRPGLASGPLFTPCIPNKDYLSGTHTAEGFWIFSDGDRKNVTAELIDLAPTVLASFGIKKAAWMNGNVLI